MGLSYDEDNSVNRDYLTQYKLDTTFLTDNSVSRDIEGQNQPFVFSNTAVGALSLTLTYDVIITQFSMTVAFSALGGVGLISTAININGVYQDGVSATAPNLATNNASKSSSIPNWFLPSGTQLTIGNGVVNGGTTSWLTSIIGYRV